MYIECILYALETVLHVPSATECLHMPFIAFMQVLLLKSSEETQKNINVDALNGGGWKEKSLTWKFWEMENAAVGKWSDAHTLVAQGLIH